MPRPASEILGDLPAQGGFSFWLGPAAGGPYAAYDDTAAHYAASTMKLVVLVAAHRAVDCGRLDLHTTVGVHDEFASAADGSPFGMRQDYDNDDRVWEELGHSVSLGWLVERMIVRSSNLATNLVLERVGMPAVQASVRDLGLENSIIRRGIEDAAAQEAGLDNQVCARDLATTLQAVLAGTAASPGACRAILTTLRGQQIRDTIPAGLPEGTEVAHKSGWVPGVVHDAGIVLPDDAQPFVLAVCTTSSLTHQEGCALIARAAAAAWRQRKHIGSEGDPS